MAKLASNLWQIFKSPDGSDVLGESCCVDSDDTVFIGSFGGIFKKPRDKELEVVIKPQNEGDKSTRDGPRDNATVRHPIGLDWDDDLSSSQTSLVELHKATGTESTQYKGLWIADDLAHQIRLLCNDTLITIANGPEKDANGNQTNLSDGFALIKPSVSSGFATVANPTFVLRMPQRPLVFICEWPIQSTSPPKFRLLDLKTWQLTTLATGAPPKVELENPLASPLGWQPHCCRVSGDSNKIHLVNWTPEGISTWSRQGKSTSLLLDLETSNFAPSTPPELISPNDLHFQVPSPATHPVTVSVKKIESNGDPRLGESVSVSFWDASLNKLYTLPPMEPGHFLYAYLSDGSLVRVTSSVHLLKKLTKPSGASAAN